MEHFTVSQCHSLQ